MKYKITDLLSLFQGIKGKYEYGREIIILIIIFAIQFLQFFNPKIKADKERGKVDTTLSFISCIWRWRTKISI